MTPVGASSNIPLQAEQPAGPPPKRQASAEQRKGPRMKGWSGKRESEMASNQTSGIQGTGVTREEKNGAMPFMVGYADINGTSLQGELRIPFSRIVEVFGEPGEGDGYKVAFEWDITFADGTVATIYDYKSSSLYDDEQPSPEQLRAANFDDWHIGGNSRRALELVREALTTTVRS